MKLPNFLVVGAPKCGTTSLYYYLKQHRDIYLPERKELHYFSYDHMKNSAAGPGDSQILYSLCKTRKEYREYFSKVKNEKAVGEISPSYFYFSETSEKIEDVLGTIKIVLLIRDPIEKAFSQYMHLVRDSRETLTFNDALMHEKKRMKEGRAAIWRYAESSLYCERIKKYINVFAKQNVKIILFEDLKNSPRVVLRDLFQFLGIDDSIDCDTSKKYNRSGRPKSKWIAKLLGKPNVAMRFAMTFIPEKIRTPVRLALLEMNTGKKDRIDGKSAEYLREYFKYDIKELEKIIERKLNWLN